MQYEAHPSAIISPGAKIGIGSRIWHFCHIMDGAVIGEDCSLGQNCFVAGGALIEQGVKIQNNVSVYEGVVIKERVFIGPGVVFTNIKTPRAFISRKSEYLTTTIMPGASIGGGAVIICGTTVGRYTIVGAGAVVSKSLPDYAVAVGNPARVVARACRCGAVIWEEADICPDCAEQLPEINFSFERRSRPCDML